VPVEFFMIDDAVALFRLKWIISSEVPGGDGPDESSLLRLMLVCRSTSVLFLIKSGIMPYPVALEQAYAATKWAAQNGQTIHVNPSRLGIVGDGGSLLPIYLTPLLSSFTNYFVAHYFFSFLVNQF
jgi:hypothetical protein